MHIEARNELLKFVWASENIFFGGYNARLTYDYWIGMNPAQREQIVDILQKGNELPVDWANVLFPPEKREYELVYHGKEREEDVVVNTLAVPLQPMRFFNKGIGSWSNKLVFGDNLQAMKSLLEEKKAGRLCNADGKPGVRLVYIDPPFATKLDFKGSRDQKAYQDKVVGAKFIEFVRRRLILLRELMADDGCIYVHLDTRKSHYIKTVLDEVFGEENFINEIVWQRSTAHNMKTKGFARCNDHIFLYSKSDRFTFNEQYIKYGEAQLSRYKADENGRLYKGENLTFSGANPNRQFEWRGTKPPPNRSWGATLEQLEEWWEEGLILQKKDGSPRMDGLKIYLDETQGGTPVSTNWTDIDRIGNTSSERMDYPTQKPESLLERIIRTSSHSGDLVLDAFAGSGTTCAVSEKLNRRWIAIDCGKLAIYTIQKRMLNLKTGIGNKGGRLISKPFTLFNAGLYDFSKLKDLPWESWRFFALQLFQCKDEPHAINGVNFDGYLKGSSVLVFNPNTYPNVRLDEDSVRSLHDAAGSRLGSKMFIIAPSLSFDFQQDYLDIDGVRYYALRIPYSIIHELHQREFMALKQPVDETAVNDTVDAVGFDFIRTPEIEYSTGIHNIEGQLLHEACIRIHSFRSEAFLRNPSESVEQCAALSMVLLDYDYGRGRDNSETDIFELDEVIYADALKKADWEVRFSADRLGDQVMVVFIDIYGNEARDLIPSDRFKTLEARQKLATAAGVKKNKKKAA